MPSFSEAEIKPEGLHQLHQYWRRKKGERVAPARAEIQPEELVPLLPHVFLVDVEGARFRLRLVGTEIVRDYGREITGAFLDEIDLDDHKAAILHEYAVAVSQRAPQFSVQEFEKDDGRYLRYSRLILPLSSDGQSVDKLLGGAYLLPLARTG